MEWTGADKNNQPINETFSSHTIVIQSAYIAFF